MVWRTLFTSCYKELLNSLTKWLKLYYVWCNVYFSQNFIPNVIAIPRKNNKTKQKPTIRLETVIILITAVPNYNNWQCNWPLLVSVILHIVLLRSSKSQLILYSINPWQCTLCPSVGESAVLYCWDQGGYMPLEKQSESLRK